VEERIAARLGSARDLQTIQIDGKTTPHLFLPVELFGGLVNGLDEGSIAATRSTYATSVRAAGWNEAEFWFELSRIAARYLAAQAESLKLQASMDALPPARHRETEALVLKLGFEQCRLRAQALNTARERFGPAFDRFLYTAVAQQMTIASSGLGPDEADRLRFLERGCR
jgi:hypothetical protein